MLAAEGAAQQKRLDAEAERFRKEQSAKGLLAEGIAQAKVDQERKKSRYEGAAGARQAAVEINKARVEMFKNMKFDGFLPEKTALTIINGNTQNPVPTINLNEKESNEKEQ